MKDDLDGCGFVVIIIVVLYVVINFLSQIYHGIKDLFDWVLSLFMNVDDFYNTMDIIEGVVRMVFFIGVVILAIILYRMK